MKIRWLSKLITIFLISFKKSTISSERTINAQTDIQNAIWWNLLFHCSLCVIYKKIKLKRKKNIESNQLSVQLQLSLHIWFQTIEQFYINFGLNQENIEFNPISFEEMKTFFWMKYKNANSNNLMGILCIYLPNLIQFSLVLIKRKNKRSWIKDLK